MDESMKKMLTEWLGECRHEFVEEMLIPAKDRCIHCSRLRIQVSDMDNRTFTTWQDLGDVKEKLVEKGMWEEFYWYARDAWEESHILNRESSEFSSWLFRPINEKGEPHFCRLVAEKGKGD